MAMVRALTLPRMTAVWPISKLVLHGELADDLARDDRPLRMNVAVPGSAHGQGQIALQRAVAVHFAADHERTGSMDVSDEHRAWTYEGGGGRRIFEKSTLGISHSRLYYPIDRPCGVTRSSGPAAGRRRIEVQCSGGGVRPFEGKMRINKPVLVLGCALMFGLSGCSRQQSDWQKARETNTAEAYEHFLKEYPSGEFTAQAQARLKELGEESDWQKARDADTSEAYQAFLKQHPEGKWTEEARIRVENLTLAQAPETTAPGSSNPAGGTAASGTAAPPGAAANPAGAPHTAFRTRAVRHPDRRRMPRRAAPKSIPAPLLRQVPTEFNSGRSNPAQRRLTSTGLACRRNSPRCSPGSPRRSRR